MHSKQNLNAIILRSLQKTGWCLGSFLVVGLLLRQCNIGTANRAPIETPFLQHGGIPRGNITPDFIRQTWTELPLDDRLIIAKQIVTDQLLSKFDSIGLTNILGPSSSEYNYGVGSSSFISFEIGEDKVRDIFFPLRYELVFKFDPNIKTNICFLSIRD